MPVIRCACALLVTPYKLLMVNNWPTLGIGKQSLNSAGAPRIVHARMQASSFDLSNMFSLVLH